VKQLAGTGKYKVDDMIQKIATGTNYDSKALIPICDAYNASVLDVGHTAWRLRAAIRLRLAQDAPDGKVAAVTLDASVDAPDGKDANAPISLDSE